MQTQRPCNQVIIAKSLNKPTAFQYKINMLYTRYAHVTKIYHICVKGQVYHTACQECRSGVMYIVDTKWWQQSYLTDDIVVTVRKQMFSQNKQYDYAW